MIELAELVTQGQVAKDQSHHGRLWSINLSTTWATMQRMSCQPILSFSGNQREENRSEEAEKRRGAY